MLWQQVGDWYYEYFGVDDDPPELEPFADFVGLWREKRGRRAMPAWKDYDWYDLEPWWGRILIIDIHRGDPFDFRYRLCGGQIVHVFGAEVTGKWASAVADDKAIISSHDLEFYELVTAKPHLVYTHGALDWQNRPYKSCAFCEVPLSDGGDEVKHILSVMQKRSR